MSRPDVVVLKNVRLGFPKLWHAEKATDSSAPKFSAHAIIDPSTATGKANIEAIKAAQKHVAVAQWGEKWQQVVKGLEKNRRSFRDGNSMTNNEGDIYAVYEDMKFIAANRSERQGRPTVLTRSKKPTTEEDGLVYAGCYVDMVVSFFTTSKKDQGGNGLFCSLETIRFRDHGEAFGGGMSADEAKDYLDDLDDEDDLDGDGETADSGSDDDEDDDLV